MHSAVKQNVLRKDGWDKVTAKAKYTDDLPTAGVLCARLLTSTCAHGKIRRINTEKALALFGVLAVLTGESLTERFGPLLLDRPALAKDVVRYAGEHVAMVVAVDEPTAEKAVRLIEVEYEPLPAVLTPSEALKDGAPLVHPNPKGYKKVAEDVYPKENSNVASRYQVRKGNISKAFAQCAAVVERRIFLPPSDHMAMEVRAARAEIKGDGRVVITSSTQSPFTVRKQLSEAFLIPEGNISVIVPFVGGGFGGKAPVTLEILAFLASRAVGGRPVRLTIPREQDMATAPGRLGLEAIIRLGAGKDGLLQAAEMTFYLDCGAYADIAPYMAKAIAADCTGPYHVENLSCDVLCVYTNHTYATSFRSFAHESFTFCVERTLDVLANQLCIDPLELRLKNAIRSGSTTPTQVPYTPSLIGNVAQCLQKVKALSGWDGAKAEIIKPHTVRAMGVSCLWKTANPPTDAISGALVTFNADGSANLNIGAVEMGSLSHTEIAQMLAEKLGIGVDQVHINSEVNTLTAPEHWKTVASLTGYMAGNAVMRAAEDALSQLKSNGAQALNCHVEEVDVAHGRVFSIKNPERFILLKDIVHGYKAGDGSSVGEPVIGRGGFMLKGLSELDPQTGKGKTGPAWTVGAQVVEIEADLRTFTYRVLSASTVMDVGCALNPEGMRASIAGGMAMGISLASREGIFYDEQGIPKTPNLRTYKLLHIGQEPEYRVDFVETPQEDAPYGMRSYSEHGIIGIPAALGNALSAAFEKEFNFLPLNPERLWRAAMEDGNDTL